jgi:5-methylcytosine-specific restriction endonuclease McrA
MICKRCNEDRPANAFKPNRVGSTQMRTTCARCNKLAHRRAKGILPKPPKIERERAPVIPLSRLLADHPDAAWRLEYRNALYRAKYQRDPVAERSRVRLYKHANPERVALWGNRRQQLAASTSDGTLTRKAVVMLLALAHTCPYCDTPLCDENKSLDHIIPLSRGGAHSIENAVVCCATCNISKNDRTPLEYMGSAWFRANSVRFRESAQLVASA